METKLKTLINKLVQEELSLMEKKKKKEEPVELDIDTTIEEPSAEEAEAELAAEPAAPMGGEMDMSGGDSTEKTIGKGWAGLDEINGGGGRNLSSSSMSVVGRFGAGAGTKVVE